MNLIRAALSAAGCVAAICGVAFSAIGSSPSNGTPTTNPLARPASFGIDQWEGIERVLEPATLLPSPDGVGGRDGQFGFAVSIDADRAVVGGPGLSGTGLVLVFEYRENKWVETAVLQAEDADGGDFFGFSVDIDGDRVLVGAVGDDENGSFSGSAYVFESDGSAWNQVAKLLPDEGAMRDQFGISVSISGTRALVGANGTENLSADASGAAYVFNFEDSSWTQEAKLVPLSGADREFGTSVSVSGDRLLVGAPGNNSGVAAGAAHVFDHTGSGWSETAEISPLDGNLGDLFGASVNLLGDRAVVGAPRHAEDGNVLGSAHMFDLVDGNWVETSKMLPDEESVHEYFGVSVSLENDLVLVGASRNSSNAVAGSAFIFGFDGIRWSQLTRLVPSDGAAGDFFGFSVGMSGNRLLAGAGGDDIHGFQSGSAYVYEFDTGTWSEAAKLVPAEGAVNDRFGYSVSVWGNRALVGAYLDDENGLDAGAAYVFEYGDTGWQKVARLLPTDGRQGDGFGFSVSLYEDRAVVGAIFDDDNLTDSGSAYVFDFDGTAWTESAKIMPADADRFGAFGGAVSLHQDRALVGSLKSGPGAAHVFDFDGTHWTETATLRSEDMVADDRFGWSVSLYGDRALVGARFANGASAVSGSVYVFEFDGITWNEAAKLFPADGSPGDSFGDSVSLFGDTALIGASGAGGPNTPTGSAYMFEFHNQAWFESAQLVPPEGDFDEFGRPVSLSGDHALIGGSGESGGAAYLFINDGINWSHVTKLVAPENSARSTFGNSLSISGNRALVGASRSDNNGTNSGAAYAYDDINNTDIEIAKTDGASLLNPGADITYAITVTNLGPLHATGVHVQDVVPSDLTNASWTCTSEGSGLCNEAGSVGNIDDMADLPAGESVMYVMVATAVKGFSGLVSNTATVTLPNVLTDSNPENNSATDLTRISELFADGFEPVPLPPQVSARVKRAPEKRD